MKRSNLIMVILALAMLLSLVVGCSGKSGSSTTSTQSSQIPNNYTTYSDSTSLFSISYPAQWETTGTMSANQAQIRDAIDIINGRFPISYNIMLFEAGLKTGTIYDPTINITVQPSALVNNSQQAGESVIDELKQTDPNLQVISQTLITLNGRDAALVESKVQTSNGLMHELFLVYLNGTNLWTLTCTAKDVDYSNWSSDFNSIVETFVISKWPE